MSKLLEQINTESKKVSKLVDFAMINPVVRLERDKEYPFLDMSEVKALTRIPELNNRKVFTGSGSKFEKGDTLFARITPCLENGKITRVLNLNTPAFGSTEFIVLRGKDGISDNDFIYYLTQTYKLRKKAEQSMIGASGCQRVDRVAFENIPVTFPNLPTQKKIAEILGAYDAKIENNNRIIKNLEVTAQTIFNEWFVNFHFPGYEKAKMVESNTSTSLSAGMGDLPAGKAGILEGWRIKNVLEVIERIPVGKKFENKTASPVGKVPILDQGASGFIGYHNEEPGVIASIESPIVVFTNHTCYYRLLTEPFSCIQNVLPYIGKNGYKTLFVYFLTKEKIKMSEYKGHWPEFEQQIFVIPPVELANSFVSKIESFVSKIVVLEKENAKLKESRDQLLAKLI